MDLMKDAQELEVKRPFYSQIMKIYRENALGGPLLASLIRMGLQSKIAVDRLRINLLYRGKRTEIREWFDRRRIFFGFAIFRSGTAFLATFLNKVLPDAVVEHEANVNDYWYYHLALRSEEEAERYIRDFRMAEIYSRMHRRPEGLYGEINPYLRRHYKALRKELPRAKFFHLVRDGREVVRSIMSREILDKADPLGYLTQPPSGDPYAERWKGMSRFERICWLWQSDNKYLRENVGLTLRFERLITDYDYFRTKLTEHLGIEVSQEIWQRYTRRIGNPTQVFRMDRWSQWSDSEREQFRTICGEEMRACGYDFE